MLNKLINSTPMFYVLIWIETERIFTDQKNGIPDKSETIFNIQQTTNQTLDSEDLKQASQTLI